MHRCPYCQSHNIAYSSSEGLHAVRRITNSPKRYCRVCHKKWLIKSTAKVKINSSWILILIFGLILLVLLQHWEQGHGVRNIGYNASSLNGGAAPSWKTEQDAAKKEIGGSTLTSSQKSLLSAYSKGSNKNSKDNSLLSSLIPWNMVPAQYRSLNQDQLLAKLERFRNDPNAVKKLSPDKQKLVEQALDFTKNRK